SVASFMYSTFPQTSIQPRVLAAPGFKATRGTQLPPAQFHFSLSVSRFRHQGRNFAVGGIRDQGCPVGFDNRRCAIPPEIVVSGLNISFPIRETCFAGVCFYGSLLQFGHFLRSEKLSTGKTRGTFQGSNAVVIPNTLQIRMSPRRAWWCRYLFRRDLGHLAGDLPNSRQQYDCSQK